MADDRLEQALDRADYALRRITRSLDDRSAERPPPRDEELRAKVREAIAELDTLIREAAN